MAAAGMVLIAFVEDSAATSPIAPFSISESYTSVPPQLSGVRDLGWHVQYADGRCEFVDRPAPDADLAISVDYELARQFATATDAGASASAGFADAVADGRLTMTGDPRALPRLPNAFHGLLAPITR